MKAISQFSLNKTRTLLLPVILGSALIAGCGGGGAGGTTASATLSGTAASGAPITGAVTVKDSAGTEKTVQISVDGSYSIDVSGMATGPFLLKASGTVGSKSVTLLSVATTTDVNGKINITPFTDLIVANVSGKSAEEFYNAPNYSLLVRTELDTAEDTLQKRLKPLLDKLGILATIDLLRTEFKADHSGLDGALDMVNVTIDPVTLQATIKDIEGKFITDDLKSKLDVSEMPISSIDFSAVAAALRDMQAQFDTLSSQFASAVPSAGDPALFDPTFMNDGQNLTAFMADLATVPNIVGVKFRNISIEEYKDANTVKIECEAIAMDGKNHTFKTWMKKDPASSKWLIAGDGELIETEVDAFAEKMSDGTIKTGLRFSLDGANTNPLIDYVVVKGLGLPTAGIKMVRSSGNFVIETTPDSQILACATAGATGCVDTAAMLDNTGYTFELWDDKNTPTDITDDTMTGTSTTVLSKAPYSSAYVTSNAAKLFPTITPPTLASFLLGGGQSVSWTLPAGIRADEVAFDWTDGTLSGHQDADAGPTSVSVNVNVGTFSFTPTSGNVSLVAEDIYGRKIVVSVKLN